MMKDKDNTIKLVFISRKLEVLHNTIGLVWYIEIVEGQERFVVKSHSSIPNYSKIIPEHDM